MFKIFDVLNKEKLNFILFLIGFNISIISSFFNKISYIPFNNPFGILGLLPSFFWLGFFIMILTYFIGFNKKNKLIFFSQSLIIFILIWNIPTLFENYFSVWDSIFHFENSLRVHKIFNENLWSWNNYYVDWPGFFYIGYFLFKISTISVAMFLKYYRIFSSIITFLAMYFFFSAYSNKKEFKYSLAISMFIIVWQQFHYSAQSIGLAMSLIILGLYKTKTRFKIVSILTLSIFLLLSHPVNFILCYVALGGLLLIRYLSNKLKKPDYLFLYISIILLFVVWIIFSNANFAKNQIQRIAIFGEDSNFIEIVSSRLYGNTVSNIEKIEYSTKITEPLEYEYSQRDFHQLQTINNSEDYKLENIQSKIQKIPLFNNPIRYSETIRTISFIVILFIFLIYFSYLLFKRLNLDSNKEVLSILLGIGLLFIFSEILYVDDWRDRFLIYFFILGAIIIPRITKNTSCKLIKVCIIFLIGFISVVNFSTIYSKEVGNFIGPQLYTVGNYLYNNEIGYCNINNINDSNIKEICYLDIFHYDYLKLKSNILVVDDYREIYTRGRFYISQDMDKYYSSNRVKLFFSY